MKKVLLFSTLLLTLVLGSKAQGVYDDFVYGRNAVKERHVIRWQYLREADVMYSWRVERIIDVREKMNVCMAWPKNPLYKVLETAVKVDHSLVPYSTDSMNRPMTTEDINKKLNYTIVIAVPIDPNDPYNTRDSEAVVEYKWEDIKRFKIMEDWIFDKKESRFYCRIIYVAPMYQPYAGGITVGESPICYFRYHDNSGEDTLTFREVVVNQEVYNRFNDAARLSFDDFFEQRMFSSYIIKESNPFDNRIKDFEEYKDDGVAALLESDNIKRKLFETEHDLWEF